MRRPDAMTVSRCEINVTPERACYHYQPEPDGQITELCLPLATTP